MTKYNLETKREMYFKHLNKDMVFSEQIKLGEFPKFKRIFSKNISKLDLQWIEGYLEKIEKKWMECEEKKILIRSELKPTEHFPTIPLVKFIHKSSLLTNI